VILVKIAVVSDVHGNLTALETVIRDIQRVGVDLVVNGGDLIGSGPRPAEVIDRVAGLGWQGIIGNTDEVLWNAQPLIDLAARLPAMKTTWNMVLDDVEWTRSAIGNDRIQWLRSLPGLFVATDVAIVHASPGDTWKDPGPTASDDELAAVYATLRSPAVVFGHLHVPFVRPVHDFIVANSGSAGMPYDGDPRASYLVIEDGQPTVRRVAYDIDSEIEALAVRNHPHRDWMSAILRSGAYVSRSPMTGG
jgi:putative phosphoesterase